MILEEGTDEQLKRCVEEALLPPVGSLWEWSTEASSRRWLKVLDVDEGGVIHVQYNDSSILNFTYTLRYWVQDAQMHRWRQA